MKQTKTAFRNKPLISSKGSILFLIFIPMIGLVRAQYSMGTTGQLMIPTAEVQGAGTFMEGVNFLPEQVTPSVFSFPTTNYFVDMTLFPFVEFTYRMTLLKMTTGTDRMGYHNQDRSNTIRIRLIKESRYFPAVVIGRDDLLIEKKTPYWGAYYGVLTKTIGLHLGDQLTVTAGWYTHQGDYRVSSEEPFRGVRYTPFFYEELKPMVKYDTHGWNMGVAMRFWKHLSVNVFTYEFTCVSADLRHECTLIR